MLNRLLIASISSLIVGCATPAGPRILYLSTSFDRNEVRWSTDPGDNSVSGQAFMRTQGGTIVTCAGLETQLIPVSKYSTQRIVTIYGSSESGFRNWYDLTNTKFEPDSLDYQNFNRKITCDAQGNFKFDKLANGSYYLVSAVLWTAGEARQGGAIMRRVTLKDGENKNIIVSP
jgi:hypothetical protein